MQHPQQVRKISTPQVVSTNWGFCGGIKGILRGSREVPLHIHRGVAMKIEHRLDELIKAAWGVVDSDFDPIAFQYWRLKAFECLTAMFGPDHVYTKYFQQFAQQSDVTNALAAGGILVAAKEHLKAEEYGTSERLWDQASPASHQEGWSMNDNVKWIH